MKILVAVVALSFVICSDADIDTPALVRVPEILKCFEEVDIEEYTRWSHKDIKPADVSAETRCAIKCILESYNVIDEDTGELLLEEFRNRLLDDSINDDNWNKMVEPCQHFQTENTCDKPFKTLACFDLYTQLRR